LTCFGLVRPPRGRSSLTKAECSHGRHYFTQVQSNRRVDPDTTGNRSIADCVIAATDRFRSGVSWFEAQWDVVRVYLANPRYNLPDTATA
jgi:hypothetical protein